MGENRLKVCFHPLIWFSFWLSVPVIDCMERMLLRITEWICQTVQCRLHLFEVPAVPFHVVFD